MHIIVGLVLLLGALYLAFARLNQTRGAGDRFGRGVGRNQDVLMRRAGRGNADGAAISAIEDPLTGAAVMMAAVANSREPLDAAAATVIKDELREVTGSDPRDAFEFAAWAIQYVPDPDNVSMRLTRMWNNTLTTAERQQLVDMVTRVACMKGDPTAIQADAIAKLKTRLDLK
jgi:hypothetical protein